MAHLDILTRDEIENFGPPLPEELADTDVAEAYLCELTLKHVAALADPSTGSVADKLHLSRTLTEELLYQLYREKLIEMKVQSAVGATRYAMLDHGWERLARLQSQNAYLGPAPVSLADYRHLMHLQAIPSRPASMANIRSAFHDLVLPDSLLQTLGCVINSRTSLFLTGLAGTGKTAVSERMNHALTGSIWIPYAVEIDGQIIRIFDSHCHIPIQRDESSLEHDRRWVEIQRPLMIVGGELTLENADLAWSDSARFYEAPFQLKSNGGTLVIDDFGRQRVAPRDLLNRWIMPLERRVDFLTLHNGKKIEVPFEQLVVFSTNLNERDLVDDAFLRRMGYRASIEPPSASAYLEIFKRAAHDREVALNQDCLDHVLSKYAAENRLMKSCEPRDLISRAADICRFEGKALELTPQLIDVAWKNYFGSAHAFADSPPAAAAHPQAAAA